MKCFAITHKGTEEICAREIAELTEAKNMKSSDTLVTFDVAKYEDLFILCYKAQSAISIALHLEEFEYESEQDLLNKIKNLEIKIKSETFKVEVKHDKSINSQELEKKIGEAILKKHPHLKVSLANPELTILVCITGSRCTAGIDLAGIDLSKREYKIFANKESLKGTIAYSALRFADYNKKEHILDPFLGDGVIPIEGALYATGFPINYFRKDRFAFLRMQEFNDFDFEKFFERIDKNSEVMKLSITGVSSLIRDVTASQKNAKLAGIIKAVTLTKISVDWLDIKLKEGEIDKIITFVRSIPEESAQKEFEQLFYQAEYILSKKGSISLIIKNPSHRKFIETASEKYNFNIKKELEVWQGMQKLVFLSLAVKNH